MPNYEPLIPTLLSIGVIALVILCCFKLFDAFCAIVRRFKAHRQSRRAAGARSDLLS